ncbi:protein mono-ADP-ribosyltransferase PARP9 isoform X1 [Xyrichtys novacula]|uniref:Protein mono-ADP-ribosyltransferase PARP9 isoform X1 n=1 Tax=Xyrichtys novacula TaxID=13765 RepID=A0AAV1H0H8_XYRNO|nr:protein mono-ADP-ribosyltransferase PARP9 isoform X1 [Xyrichtys novacula]
MTSKLDVTLHGRSVNIVRQCREDLCDVLQSKFGCVAIIEGVDFEQDLVVAKQGRPTVEPQPRFEVYLPVGVRVSVWKGDLTIFRADAVVNAANTQLQHWGGLASSLSKAGGPSIQKESNDYIKKNGDLKTGEAIVTGSGQLPCNKIIHAVGPDLSPNPSPRDVSRAELLLKKAIRSILDKVREHHLQSVAIPAISSGLFHYPLPQCADTIVSTVKEYYENYDPYKHHPIEIFLVNFDEPSVTEMNRACCQILAHHKPITYSQAASSRSRDDAKTSTPSLHIGNVHLMLKKGRIEEQSTDVIVNTASENRDLSQGEISKALLKKAGYEMQKEMTNAYPSGHVIITKGYKLHCKSVFHTRCATKTGYAKQQEVAVQGLFNSVSECLWLAVSNKHRSITFPAIGTGALGFSGKEAAETMLKAVAEFAQKSPKPLEVSIVIFPSDSSIYQAFEEQMRFLRERAQHPSFELAFNNRDDFSGSKASSPQISLSGPSDKATHEAKRWLQDLLFDSAGVVIISNNFVLHFGKQEHGELSRLTEKGVIIEEFFDKGRAGIMVKGDSNEDVAAAGLQVEKMLCRIQREFMKFEEHEISKMTTKSVHPERQTLHPERQTHSTNEYKDRASSLGDTRLWLEKVEKVENPALEMLFELKKRQLNCFSHRTMFQCVPAHFLEMVSRIGFHAEYAPPPDPAFGEGIYFAGTPKKAMEMWKEMQNGKFLYFVEAEVLTGNSIFGQRGLILPPAVGKDPQIMYDSVSGGPDVSVIFSGYQALPRYIITCKGG